MYPSLRTAKFVEVACSGDERSILVDVSRSVGDDLLLRREEGEADVQRVHRQSEPRLSVPADRASDPRVPLQIRVAVDRGRAGGEPDLLRPQHSQRRRQAVHAIQANHAEGRRAGARGRGERLREGGHAERERRGDPVLLERLRPLQEDEQAVREGGGRAAGRSVADVPALFGE